MQARSVNERLAVIEENVLEIRRRLFGNGQPGVITVHGKRIGRLERWSFVVIGAVAVVVWLLERFL